MHQLPLAPGRGSSSWDTLLKERTPLLCHFNHWTGCTMSEMRQAVGNAEPREHRSISAGHRPFKWKQMPQISMFVLSTDLFKCQHPDRLQTLFRWCPLISLTSQSLSFTRLSIKGQLLTERKMTASIIIAVADVILATCEHTVPHSTASHRRAPGHFF